MAKQLYSVYAGPLQRRTLAPRRSRDDSPQQRAEKSKSTGPAQRSYNKRISWETLEEELAVNFPGPKTALVATLTIDDEWQPTRTGSKEERAVVADYVEKFRGKINRRRKKAGRPELVAFWCIEVLTDEGMRWHVHMALNNTGEDYGEIHACWKYGDVVEIQPLRIDDEKNWASLAKYMTKESRDAQEYSSRTGLPSWSHTRNIRKPERESVVVPDDYVIEIPDEAIVMDDFERGSENFPAHVVKFRYGQTAAFPHAKRRRRRSFI